MKGLSVLYAFLGGAIVGATAAILFAPEKGSDLRARIKEQRRNLVTVEGELYDAAGELCTTCTCLYFAFSREKSEKEFHFQRCLAEGEEDTI